MGIPENTPDLTIINQNGQLLADSREVAEMTDVRHSDLLEKISGYVTHLLNGKFRSVDFFIENTYQDSTGRTLPSYLLTRKGCDMIANKMTGEKGVLFTATYVTKFEEMEKSLIENRKYGALPGTATDIILNLISNPYFQKLKASAQAEIIKAISRDIKKRDADLKKLAIPASATPKTDPTPNDLLNELLSRAVPLLNFYPKSEKDLKSSVLYDEEYCYIFPFSIGRYLGQSTETIKNRETMTSYAMEGGYTENNQANKW